MLTDELQSDWLLESGVFVAAEDFGETASRQRERHLKQTNLKNGEDVLNASHLGPTKIWQLWESAARSLDDDVGGVGASADAVVDGTATDELR